MNPRYRSRVGAPPQLAADAAASAIYCAMPFLVVHYLGDWRAHAPVAGPPGRDAGRYPVLPDPGAGRGDDRGWEYLPASSWLQGHGVPAGRVAHRETHIQKRTVQLRLSLCARGNRSLAGAQNRQSPWREKHSVRSNDETIGAADETGLAAAV